METRGGRVHHAYGRCAPYIRNSRTIHAVPMHHHPRFCCSLGAAYAYVKGCEEVFCAPKYQQHIIHFVLRDTFLYGQAIS